MYADAISVIECGHSECRHHRNQGSKSPERNDQAKEKQQVIGSIEDMVEPQLDKSERRLISRDVTLGQDTWVGGVSQVEKAPGDHQVGINVFHFAENQHLGGS